MSAHLEDYAARVGNGHQFQRRLFAQDAEQGLAFIDLFWKTFDVVLMNPPCGTPTSQGATELPKESAGNLYPAFVIRGLSVCTGLLGAITDRTFFVQDTFKKYRRALLAEPWSLHVAADLGWGVLDTADVQVAAYVVASGKTPDHLFVDVREPDEKGPYLLAQLEGGTSEGFSILTSEHFQRIPNAVFCYSLPHSVLDRFVRDESLTEIAELPRGLGSNKAFRTYRAWYEVPVGAIGEGQRYRTLCNGGDFSPFFREDAGVADWARCDGKALVEEGYEDGFPAYDQKKIDHYFVSGLSFPKQSSVFNAAALSADAIPTREGKAIVPHDESDCWFLLGYLNCSLVRKIVETTTGLHKQSGSIGLIPVPQFSEAVARRIAEIAKDAAYRQMRPLMYDETSRLFRHPAGVQPARERHEQTLSPIRQIDQLVFDALGLDETARKGLSEDVPTVPTLFRPSRPDLLSYAVGCPFGRWDVRVTQVATFAESPVDPLAEIPDRPPGMLVCPGGGPVKESFGEYPLQIDGDGILVDDAEHQDDIVRRVREVLELIWPDRAEAIEKEACEILGVTRLRDYFRKPSKGGFWDDHVKRYSKSRRKAPIYWLLQSSRKNYALWLYYHRLDKDMLFKALVNYVEPKIRLEENRLESLRSQKSAGGGSKKLDKEMEHQADLLSELRDFEDKLRRAANLHLEPDLNDGVVLNIAPLRELVPWKEAKKYWEELTQGKYEWSTIGKQLRERGLVS